MVDSNRNAFLLRWISVLALTGGLAYDVFLVTTLATRVLPEVGGRTLLEWRVPAPLLFFVVGLALVGLVIGLERWLRAAQRRGVLARRLYVAFSVEAGVLLAIPAFFAQELAVSREIHGLLFPYPMDYGEGQIIDQVSRLAHGLPVYFTTRATQTTPYTIANYPPFYALVQVPFVWIFGMALWYGRVVSLVGVLMAGACIALIIHATTGSRAAGLVGGLTVLCMPPIYLWAPLVRVDQLALGLSLLGLYITVRYPKGTAALILAAACLVAAAYTKQSYAISAPLAAFAWLWSQGDRRRACLLAAFVASLGAAIFTLLTLATDGGFYFNVVTATARGDFSWGRVYATLDQISRRLPVLVLGSGVFVALGFWRSLRSSTWALVCAYLAGALAETVTIGKNGSNMNYLYEISAAFGLVTGAGLAWPGPRHRWATLILAVLVATQIRSMVDWSLVNYSSLNGVFAQQRELAELAQLVRDTPGPVLADETMGLLPLAGKPVDMQPFEFKQLNDAEIWDDRNIAADIQSRKYAAILIRRSVGGWDNFSQRWTLRQRMAIQESYEVSRSYDHNLVYTPKKP